MMRIRVSLAGVLVALLFSLAAPAFAQSPKFPADRINAILLQTAHDCDEAWRHAHDGGPQENDFMIEADRRLYDASGGTVGGNWSRAQVGRFSRDGISVEFTDGRYYFQDVIGGAGGPNPTLHYSAPGLDALLRDSSGNYAPQGFIHARDLPPMHTPCGASTPPPPTPTPTPAPAPPTDLKPILDAIGQLQQLLERLHVKVDELAGKATAHDQVLSIIEAAADAAFKQAQSAADTAREILNATPLQACSSEQPGRCPEYVFRVFGSTVVARPRQ